MQDEGPRCCDSCRSAGSPIALTPPRPLKPGAPGVVISRASRRPAAWRCGRAGWPRSPRRVGTIGLAREDAEYRLGAARADGQVRRADAPLRLLGEDALHDAVLERVVADDRDPSARGAASDAAATSACLEDLELAGSPRCAAPGTCVVAGCGPSRRAAAGIAALMTSTSSAGGGDGAAGSRGYDECCDARGPPFLTVVTDDPGEVCF